MHDWKFKEQKNTAVFTTKDIADGTGWIKEVCHDQEDGAWQFISSHDMKLDEANASVVSLENVVELDPTVEDPFDLPVGWTAQRSSKESEWVRVNRTENKTFTGLASRIISTAEAHHLDLSKEYLIDFSFTGEPRIKQEGLKMFADIGFSDISHESNNMLIVQIASVLSISDLTKLIDLVEKITLDSGLAYDGWSISLV